LIAAKECHRGCIGESATQKTAEYRGNRSFVTEHRALLSVRKMGEGSYVEHPPLAKKKGDAPF
jgi:hypothetical protein